MTSWCSHIARERWILTGLFGLVSYLVTGMTLALVVIAASIAWFLLNFPTEDRARRLVQGAIESA